MPGLPSNDSGIGSWAAGVFAAPPGGWRSVSLRPASWPNTVLAAGLIGVLVGSWVSSPDTEINSRTVAGGVLSLVPFVLLLWRPRIPELLLGTAVVCGVAAALLGVTGGPDVVATVAVYTIATKRTREETIAGIAVGMLGSGVAILADRGFDQPLEEVAGLLVMLALYAGVATLGRSIGGRRAYLRTLVDRTEDLERERERLEAEREELARRAVADERARIARELHDVVAHHVSVMVIQAGAAQATLPADAQATGQSLEAIRQTGREALAEMRRMLGLLHADSALDAAGDGRDAARGDGGNLDRASEPALAPQPGLSDLPALAERMREAGLVVDLESGRARRLPPGMDLSAYRIVQEALTNTLRHAGAGAHVRIGLDFEPDELAVEVADDGRGRRSAPVERAPNEVGHGLVGMRERVALFGGTLEAGPRAEGGFRVRARFPTEAAPFPAGGTEAADSADAAAQTPGPEEGKPK
jgi:signal transduction histidine kinase